MSRTKLGLQVDVKGVGLDSADGLAASAISGNKAGYFYIRIDSVTGTTGIMDIKNTEGETVLNVPYNVTDEWYPEPIQEIIADVSNTVTGITYGVAF